MNLPRISYAAYGFALTIIIVDQLTKAWVLARLGTTDLALIPNGCWISGRRICDSPIC